MRDVEINFKQSLLDNFDHNFDSFKNDPIVLYGIGEKTEIILQLENKYNIIGLMDSNSVGDTVYGFRVLTNQEVIKKAAIIIIVANIASCPAIYKRIEFLRKEHGIKIFYLNGFIPETNENCDRDPYWRKGLNHLYKEIEMYDIISFDIFDTIIMRKVLLPTDIFELVEERLKKQYNIDIDFKKNRIKAERNCYQKVDKYCDLVQIYEELKKITDVCEDTLEKIRKLEYDIEFENCVARDDILSAYNYAINNKKTVYLITDMYWDRKILVDLLARNSIYGYEQLLISCEQKKSKQNGDIWELVLKEMINGKILHIGDNQHADIEVPQKYGISTYHIRSSLELIQSSDLRYLYDSCENKLTDNLILGKFAASALNSPFSLSKYKGKLEIETMFDMGFLILGPLVLNYVLWLIKKCDECKIDKVLFFSRDGYFIKKIYDFISIKMKIKVPNSIYFLTSRRAASVATIKDLDDIEFIIKNLCKIKKCKIGEIIFRGFGIEMDNDDKLKDMYYFQLSEDELIFHIQNKYAERIIKTSKVERLNYEKYIRKQNIDLENNIGCVNFIGRGLTQKFVEVILGRSMNGFYFATESEIKKFLKSSKKNFGLYGEYEDTCISKSYLISNYIVGEIIFSSPDEQLIKFDKKGCPIYNNKSNKRDFSLIEQCHQGIEKYITNFLKYDTFLLEREFDTGLIDKLFGLLVSDKSVFSNQIKKGLLFNDYYNSESENIYIDLN
ncbi:MAG: haloacid dehalogenase [Acetobacterium woodii]|nr:haloacid dehalogenase [Acetobacterium woodii]